MSPLLDPDDMPQWLASLTNDRRLNIHVVAGVNDDDCAVVRWKSPFLVATCDFLNASPMAIQLGIGSLWDLGRLVVAASISDLCGSGAKPLALLVGVTLPYKTTVSDFKRLMRGVKYEADKNNVSIIGGDSKLGHTRALIVTALGSVTDKRQLFLKNRARPDDIVWTSGNLGSAAAAVWGYGKSQLTKSWQKWAKQVILVPSIPLGRSRCVATNLLGHGGTDISDGLGADLTELCRASRVGAIVEARQIPTAVNVKIAARLAGVEPWHFAFVSGGDFQFLVTTNARSRLKMKRLGFIEIGKLTRSLKRRIRICDGTLVSLPDKGHRDSKRLTFQQETENALRGFVS